MRKHFSFIYPITIAVADPHRREGLRYDHTGDWRINGIAYTAGNFKNPENNIEFEISEIVYDGTDINPIIQNDMLGQVRAACTNHIQNLFADSSNDQIPHHHKIGHAKLIYFPLLSKVK